MEIKVINLGGISQSFVKEGIFYYLEKIKPLAEISLIMPSKKINYSSKNDKLKKQAEFGLKYLDNAYNIFLDINGKQFDSVTFASFFEKVISNKKIINFFIGGDEGFDEKFKENSDIIISLSPHTFNHELVTLILFEIIYRTFSIIRNYPYHK